MDCYVFGGFVECVDVAEHVRIVGIGLRDFLFGELSSCAAVNLRRNSEVFVRQI